MKAFFNFMFWLFSILSNTMHNKARVPYIIDKGVMSRDYRPAVRPRLRVRIAVDRRMVLKVGPYWNDRSCVGVRVAGLAWGRSSILNLRMLFFYFRFLSEIFELMKPLVPRFALILRLFLWRPQRYPFLESNRIWPGS